MPMMLVTPAERQIDFNAVNDDSNDREDKGEVVLLKLVEKKIVKTGLKWKWLKKLTI